MELPNDHNIIIGENPSSRIVTSDDPSGSNCQKLSPERKIMCAKILCAIVIIGCIIAGVFVGMANACPECDEDYIMR
jgi:hypothetical protein